MTCRITVADPDVITPHALGRKTPAEVGRIELDQSERVDCSGTGVTLATSVWAIHPDDVDGSLVLDQPVESGLVVSTRVAGGVDGTRYRITNTVTTSDQRTLALTVSLPVIETVAG